MSKNVRKKRPSLIVGLAGASAVAAIVVSFSATLAATPVDDRPPSK